MPVQFVLCATDELPSYIFDTNSGDKISRNVVTPAFILRQLAASSDPDVRMALADHSNTPEEVLLFLADDDNADVRYAIAENHNISRNVLAKLRDDSNPYVASRAAKTLSRLVCLDDSVGLRVSPCRSS